MDKLRVAIHLILTTGMSNRGIGDEVDLAFNTVRRFRQIARERNLTVEQLRALSDAEVRRYFYKRGERNEEKRLPDFNQLHLDLQGDDMTLQLLWVEYCAIEPETAYQYSQFTHLYREWAKKNGVTMRQEHTPGERGWVDFAGRTIPWVDKDTGEIHEAQVFVAALGVSHKLFAYAVPSQKLEWWVEAHNVWFAFLGAVPKMLVPDNLRSGVIQVKPETVVNPTYVELAMHYGTVVLPARARKPKDKAKVEGGVLMLNRWAFARLRNRTFHSLAEINEALRECVDIINARPMRIFKTSRNERYDSFDRPQMLELPAHRFEFGEWIYQVRVGRDYHVTVRGHHYSVPYRLVGELVNVRLTTTVAELFHHRDRVASHLRSDVLGGATTDPDHRPDSHRAWAEQSQERYQAWARTVGPHALQVVDQQFERAGHAAVALKACSGLQSLAKTYGPARFEAACGRAIEIKSPIQKSIRSILQNHLENRTATSVVKEAALPTHDNVRGPGYYAEEDSANAA